MADIWANVSMALLFLLIFGLSGTVEPQGVFGQFARPRPLLLGMFCQFLLLPLCGVATVLALDLRAEIAVPLLLTTSSPGGSFSNFWCAVANADLALSVAMTTVSTVAAVVLLPLNVILYVEFLLGSTGVPIPFWTLMPPLCIVVGAVASGLLAAHLFPSKRTILNRLGGIAGLLLILLAVASPGGGSTSPRSYSLLLVAAVSIPCLLGLVLTVSLSFFVPGISPPERMALGIETCFQNTSIALAVALQTPERGEGIAVPLLYGVTEVVFISGWALMGWKMGYSYAPPSDPICRVLLDNYQPCHRSAAIAPEPQFEESLEHLTPAARPKGGQQTDDLQGDLVVGVSSSSTNELPWVDRTQLWRKRGNGSSSFFTSMVTPSGGSVKQRDMGLTHAIPPAQVLGIPATYEQGSIVTTDIGHNTEDAQLIFVSCQTSLEVSSGKLMQVAEDSARSSRAAT